MDYRSDLIPFCLDMLDFAESKFCEARDDPASQKAAVVEAGVALALIKERLWAEDQQKATLSAFFTSLFDENERSKLTTMNRETYLEKVGELLSEVGGTRLALTI